MSDFALLWHFDGRPVDRADLNRLAAGLAGRGNGPARIRADGAIGFVHRQHHFTPQDRREAMPLAGPSGRILLADCRLNDRDALCAALGLSEDRPDGALILNAIERWDADAPHRLYGDFAFACWDPSSRRLLLARDPAGWRTLYIYRDDRMIAVSNRIRALLALPDVPQDMDDARLADLLVLNLPPPTRTPYRTIDRIPMGHVAIVGPGGIELRRSWSLPEPGSLRRRDDREYLEEGRAIIDRAVGDALRAEAPPALLLSAGIDSAAIAESAIRQRAPDPLMAITRVPDGATAPASTDRHHDESPSAHMLAGGLPGLDLHLVGDDGGDWGEHDPHRFFLEAALPSRAPQNIAWFFPAYRLLAGRGGSVTLGGEMGNLFFSASGLEYLPSLLAGGHWAHLWQQVRALARAEGQSSWAVLRQHVLKPFEPLDRRLRRLGTGDAPWAGHAALAPTAAAGLDLDPDRYRMRIGGGHRSAGALREWVWADETARDARTGIRAMTGVDHRMPLSDRRVVEFFGALPMEQHLRDGTTRSIARRLLANRIPPALVDRRGRGIQNGDWFGIVSAQRPAMIADLARLRQRPGIARLVDVDRLATLLDDWPRDAEAAEARRRLYLQMLTRGIEMARFIGWREGGNG